MITNEKTPYKRGTHKFQNIRTSRSEYQEIKKPRLATYLNKRYKHKQEKKTLYVTQHKDSEYEIRKYLRRIYITRTGHLLVRTTHQNSWNPFVN